MIKLENITKTYDGKAQVHALKGVNLTIEDGEIFGIIGKSGAGKSTLVRCINMLERPTSGNVIIDEKNLTNMTDAQLRAERKHIGMIFQHFNLLSSRTVFDNIAFPLELIGASKEAIQKKSPTFGISRTDGPAVQLPGPAVGRQKQRVGIARALASDPNILLCDEATSALDPQTTKSILELLKDINQRLGITIVIITHEMAVIKEICNRVAVIEGGVIKEAGRVVDVFTNPQSQTMKTSSNRSSTWNCPQASPRWALRISLRRATICSSACASRERLRTNPSSHRSYNASTPTSACSTAISTTFRTNLSAISSSSLWVLWNNRQKHLNISKNYLLEARF